MLKEFEKIEEAFYGNDKGLLSKELVKALADFQRPITISEFMKESPHEVATLSEQKLSSLLNYLCNKELVVKTCESKRSYFQLEEWVRLMI